MNSTQYDNEIEKLFSEWKKLFPENELFIKDGVVKPSVWFGQETRPLFLLKEAHSEPNDGEWSVSEYIKDPKNTNNKPIWKTVSKYAEGLLETNANKILHYSELKLGVDILNKVAVVNIKKSTGTSSSDNKEIQKYAVEHANNLYKELKLCDPTVIVCGYTFSSLVSVIQNQKIDQVNMDCLEKSYEKSEKGQWYYSFVLNNHKVIALDYYHPTYHTPYLLKYYGLMGLYQMALRELND